MDTLLDFSQDLENLQIGISFVLLRGLKDRSETGIATNAAREVDDNDDEDDDLGEDADEEQKDESHVKKEGTSSSNAHSNREKHVSPTNINKDIISYYITLNRDWDENNLRSERGFDAVKTIGYKLHGLDVCAAENESNPTAVLGVKHQLNTKLSLLMGCYEMIGNQIPFSSTDHSQINNTWTKDAKSRAKKQLDQMITHAMDPTRLCQMYEGWTPWV
ncbi:hypothetical protein RFI_36152 [Reticulomyxa filosa]|uniref:FATC domain-containing protein n=1 Tax=Reticulomyxa filosa TaxID=46433 RepID=X6LIU7_RETFI|nr:hypothetical protein RFI_36152 [Reticulomyxa filosa]|eukprot:ETO01286.1 hypothetical protein RFI_36152 [Reticulomyxa filosa]